MFEFWRIDYFLLIYHKVCWRCTKSWNSTSFSEGNHLLKTCMVMLYPLPTSCLRHNHRLLVDRICLSRKCIPSCNALNIYRVGMMRNHEIYKISVTQLNLLLPIYNLNVFLHVYVGGKVQGWVMANSILLMNSGGGRRLGKFPT